MNITEIKERIEELEELLEAMRNDPLAYFEDEITEEYDNLLVECFEEKVASFPFYLPSVPQLMQENDPTRYRTGLNDYADGVDVTDYDGYKELVEELETLELELEDLEESE